MIVKCPICKKEIEGEPGDIRGVVAAHRMLSHDVWHITEEEMNRWRQWFKVLPKLDKSWNER